MPFCLRLLLLAAVFALAGCSMFRPKSSSRIIEGDSPNIKYTNAESAGGRVGGR